MFNNATKKEELLIINDKKKSEFVNEGFVNLITRIWEGEISDVIINRTNRISSSSHKITLFHEICWRNEVSIHYVSNIGMNRKDVVDLDCKRLEQFQGTIREKVEHMEGSKKSIH